MADSLGEPGKGFHTHYFGIAILDVLATVFAGYLIHEFFNYPLWPTIIGLFIFGEFLHYILGVQTPVVKYVERIFARF